MDHYCGPVVSSIPFCKVNPSRGPLIQHKKVEAVEVIQVPLPEGKTLVFHLSNLHVLEEGLYLSVTLECFFHQ